MPTNLKSLLSRSRSRNELKLREKGEENGSSELNNEKENASSGQCRCEVTSTNCNNPESSDSGSSPKTTSSIRRDASCKSFFSCSAIHCMGLVGGGERENTGTCLCHRQNSCSSSSSDTGSRRGLATTGTCNSSSCCCCSYCILTNEIKDSCQSLSIRKCKTVLALSSLGSPTGQNNNNNSFNNNSASYSSPSTSQSSSSSSCSASSSSAMATSLVGHAESPGSPRVETSMSGSNASAGRVKVMKDKNFSISSSTLNSLIHSSNRTTSKLFAGWKFSNTNASNNNNSSSTASTTAPHTNHHHHHHHHRNYVSHTHGTTTVPSPVTTANSGHYPYISPGSKSKSQLSISVSETPLTPVNRFRLRRHVSVTNSSSCLPNSPALCDLYSRSSSVASFTWKEDQCDEVFCRLCLTNFKFDETAEVSACSCRYCKDCLIAYVIFEIQEGAYDIACPDAQCEKEGVLTLEEIEELVPKSLMDKHKKFRLYREVEKDSQLMWCQTPGCEMVCTITDVKDKVRPGVSSLRILCSSCEKTYCADCKLSWHPDCTCESHRRKLVKQGKLNVDDEELYSMDSIKKCPFCHIPIQKDSGCAQMMCKRCKHVFCWYCLASLDNDLLLRHYDKGPCKNKLGHSRASVVWHRAQVIGIFAGFGFLVLLASPILILAAPCLLCCRCRYCTNKLDGTEDPIPL